MALLPMPVNPLRPLFFPPSKNNHNAHNDKLVNTPPGIVVIVGARARIYFYYKLVCSSGKFVKLYYVTTVQLRAIILLCVRVFIVFVYDVIYE